jgi:hypothetical protein
VKGFVVVVGLVILGVVVKNGGVMSVMCRKGCSWSGYCWGGSYKMVGSCQ